MKYYHNIFTTSLLMRLAAVILLAGTTAMAWGFDSSHFAQSSRLAQGRWVKVAVDESGIYQITASDAQKWGFHDLSRVKVYGFGAMQMGDALESTLPDDLPQVPVLRTQDKILFYCCGPGKWRDNNSMFWVLSQHPYATRSYYFIGENDDPDVEPSRSDILPQGTIRNYAVGRLSHEVELVNPGETGRNILGEDFRTDNSQSFKFSLDGLVDGSSVNVKSIFAAKTVGGSSKVTYKYNGNNLANSSTIQAVSSTEPDHYHYRTAEANHAITLTGTKDLTYGISFSPGGTLYLARLDNITVNYDRQLSLSGINSLEFGTLYTAFNVQYEIGGAGADTRVWDVSTPWNPVEMNVIVNDDKALFSPRSLSSSQFITFKPGAQYPSPTMVEEVTNQDIHSEPTPDMIIIAPTEYMSQARTLAQLHESEDSMRVLVVDNNKVFNEFSSGTPDAMAYRLLCKRFYDRGTDESGHRLGYLLLMGNGYCDNRAITQAGKNLKYPKLLVWESEYSADENESYTSDDIYGMLDDGARQSANMRIAVGRIPARSATDASIAVSKTVKYSTQAAYGNWKNNMLNVADDGDGGAHWRHGEWVIDTIAAHGGENTLFTRVFLDNFEEISDGSGSKYPEARKKMFKALNEGVLWWNYSGHGGPTGWTNDGLLMTTDVENNLFYNHLPILFAATCEFSRHDGVSPSCGENVVLNPNGGAVAMVCPPRLVYMTENRFFNLKAAEKMYERDSNGQIMRLGDILIYAKNNIISGKSNAMRYVLYGDPALRPAMPKHKAVIDQINGKAIDPDNMPVLQARQTMTISGHIEDMKGNKASAFNGQIETSLFDCEKSVSYSYTTQRRDPVTQQLVDYDSVQTYEERQNKLAINVSKVNNGDFSIKLVIPSEVTVSYDNFRPSLVSLYAYDPENKVDATGSCDSFYIYGYDETVEGDSNGPDISYMGLNSTAFKDGDDVNESPLFIAQVSDESGINFSSAGVGHNMTLTLDDNNTFSDVSSYYTAVEAQEGSAGTINYGLTDLTTGRHTLRLKVWDVFNNSSEKTINFNVVAGLKPDIDDIKAYPNPASTTTSFVVTHNRPEATVTITIEVFNLMGQRVWSTTQSGRSTMFSSFPITWDLTDYSGTRLQRGIYLYRASISTDGHHESTKTRKLAITAQ